MNVIQSFWLDSRNHSKSGQLGGWLDPTFHYLSWILSTSLAKEKYGSVDLFANSLAKSVLVDCLNIGFKNVDLSLESMVSPSPDIWVLKKLFVYSIQDKPFLHLDGDVFLFDRLPENVFSNVVSVQNFEKNFITYRDIDRTVRTKIELPVDLYGNEECTAINVGLIASSAPQLFSEFYNLVIDICQQNTDMLNSIVKRNPDLNRYMEQLLLFNFMSNKGVTVKPIIAHNVYNSAYIGFARLERYPHLKYAHLMSGFKRDRALCYLLATIVLERYPESFFRLREYLGDSFDEALDSVGLQLAS